MKLYTEEQLRKAIELERLNNFGSDYERWLVNSEDEVINSLPPIELPSDEEIYVYINSLPYTKHLDDGQYNDGVRVGAELGIEWMKNKIHGGNL